MVFWHEQWPRWGSTTSSVGTGHALLPCVLEGPSSPSDANKIACAAHPMQTRKVGALWPNLAQGLVCMADGLNKFL
jgi:hypothetical protein